MMISSVLKDGKVVLVKEKLAGYANGELIAKCIKCNKKGAFSCSSLIKISADICLLSNKYHLEREDVVEFSTVGDFVFVHCILRGKVASSAAEVNKDLVIGNVYLCSQEEAALQFRLSAGCTQSICILLSREFYLNLISSENWAAQNSFHEQVKEKKEVSYGSMAASFGFELNQMVTDIMGCNWHSTGQCDLMQNKLKELFMQLHYQRIHHEQTKLPACPKDVYEKIKKAKNFLMANYKNPPTIKTLSRTVLLNEFELKKGFKEIYGESIRKYTIELRMKKAYVLLKTHRVNDTAEILGYKNASHFINTFKKYYGETPKRLFRPEKG